ncbi:MAG: helix-turn-helix transcriptional regulator [Clostridia bacterium]|nr:helix-turn-helix transcriptional regulator [Clostridia bacterium]
MGNYATIISELRKKAGLTQSELGEKLNVTPQAVSKWENGLSEPDVETFKKMSKLFNVSLDYLLNGKEEISLNQDDILTFDKDELIVVNEPTLHKIISGYCVKCKEPVAPGEYEVVSNGLTQEIYCKECNRVRKERQRKIEAENRSKEIKSGIFWGIVSLVISLVLGFVLIKIFGLENDAISWIVYGVGSYGLGAMVCMLIWGTWLFDIFEFFIRSFQMPGVIFTLDIDGLIFLIVVKIGLALLSGLLSLVIGLIGVIICSAIATVGFPFTLIHELKN